MNAIESEIGRVRQDGEIIHHSVATPLGPFALFVTGWVGQRTAPWLQMKSS